jgi:hypothetical protein
MATDDSNTSAYLRRPLRSREAAEIEAAQLRIMNKLRAYLRCRDELAATGGRARPAHRPAERRCIMTVKKVLVADGQFDSLTEISFKIEQGCAAIMVIAAQLAGSNTEVTNALEFVGAGILEQAAELDRWISRQCDGDGACS